MIRSQELCSDEKWDRRAEVFAVSARKAVVKILKERMEIPPMFAVSYVECDIYCCYVNIFYSQVITYHFL